MADRSVCSGCVQDVVGLLRLGYGYERVQPLHEAFHEREHAVHYSVDGSRSHLETSDYWPTQEGGEGMPELNITANGYQVKCNVTVLDRRVALSLFGIMRAFEASVIRTGGNGSKREKLLDVKSKKLPGP